MNRQTLDDLKQQIPLMGYLQAHDWHPARPLSRGRWMGLCPLHEDHQPSFLVDSNKDLFNSPRGVPTVCPRGRATHPAGPGDVIVNLSRRAPLHHPLADRFERAVGVIGAALSPGTARVYRGTARNFLLYLGDCFPDVHSLQQLRRDPHILGWLGHLHAHQPPLASITYLIRVVLLRGILEELAWTEQIPELTHLLRPGDMPRRPKRLPRPLPAEQDQALQQELLRRNGLAANVFLLLRHTGMRIGEAADLASDCLHSSGPDQWAILVPLGKLKTERMVPVDAFVCEIVQRLRFFRSLEPVPADGLLIGRSCAKATIIRKLRDYLYEVCSAARIVPHRLRHTYATEMLRSGVSVPALMKLLGHKSPDMTMLYLEVTLTDLQHEFQRARLQPRYLVPTPRIPAASARSGLDGVVDALLVAQHTLEMFRRALSEGAPRRCLDRLSNRLTKIISNYRRWYWRICRRRRRGTCAAKRFE